MTPARSWFNGGGVRLMDGAMGTMLQRAGLSSDECAADWNIDHPDAVASIHQQYVAAGAEVLLTNTFQAHRSGRVASVLRAGVRLAREAAGDQRAVLLDLGPIAEPGRREFDDLAAFERYLEDAAGPAAACEGVLLETVSSEPALAAARCAARLGRPLLLSLWFRADAGEYRSWDGHAPEWFAERAEAAGAIALGVNCGPAIRIRDCAAIVRRYRQASGLPVFARANAGTPTQVTGQWVYPQDPSTMAAELPELLAAGVCLVGGCCGTTPDHIQAFREVIEPWNAAHRRRS